MKRAFELKWKTFSSVWKTKYQPKYYPKILPQDQPTSPTDKFRQVWVWLDCSRDIDVQRTLLSDWKTAHFKRWFESSCSTKAKGAVVSLKFKFSLILNYFQCEHTNRRPTKFANDRSRQVWTCLAAANQQ